MKLQIAIFVKIRTPNIRERAKLARIAPPVLGKMPPPATAPATRAGIPGVAGRPGVPAKTIIFLEEGSFFFSRKRETKIWVCFRLLGVFLFFFGGVFALFGGVFVLLGCFFVFRASARFFFGS